MASERPDELNAEDDGEHRHLHGQERRHVQRRREHVAQHHDEIERLGDVKRLDLTSEDITEQFVDLEMSLLTRRKLELAFGTFLSLVALRFLYALIG